MTFLQDIFYTVMLVIVMLAVKLGIIQDMGEE